MTAREAFWIALEALRSHKLRSFLTLLGVVIATTTLIVVMSIVNGMNLYIAEHIANLGTNTFARLMKGLQTSLFIGLSAVTVIVVIGITVGSIAGFFGGWVDNALMRFVDIVLSIPTFFLIVMLVAFWGTGNVWVIIIAIGLTGWTTAARLVRAEFLSLREADFVQAARALGVRGERQAAE